MDAAALREALNKLARHVHWQREVMDGQGGRLIAVDANDLVTLWDAAESQFKAMTGEG